MTRDALRGLVESAELGYGGLYVQEHLFYPHDAVSRYGVRPGLVPPDV